MATSVEKTIFLAALEHETPEVRRTYLDRACAGNPVLREAVECLLAAHERTDNILDTPLAPASMWHAHLRSGPDADTAGGPPRTGGTSQPNPEGPGSFIGAYRLVEQIGEGGFGTVFVAEQHQPVRRKVALKVIKPGMDSREVIARFEAERQALAMMDHPNIAQVYDAGTTATGRPYFVMELVHGQAITQFCDEQAIALRERLELFMHVCHAVQHAHQKGIIHRDLKPPNVLVTAKDEAYVVKVIDFGVAKALGEPLTSKTICTRRAQVIGTPLYMSPEQVDLSGLDVDTRSDIYSLGVLLYELLTGTTPFEPDRLFSVSFDEMRRILREEEPPRPSTRQTTARRNGTSPWTERRIAVAAFPLTLRRDLDWIVMKALEKDRTRRYETAAEMAADIQRYLNQEPVTARPPSRLYRFSKFARRNKVLFSAGALVLGALLLGTIVSTWQAIRATTAQAEADALRQEAVEFAEHLKQANVLLDTARANADGSRWATAYAEYTTAARLQPDHYLVWSGRAALFLRLGLWDLAAADFARALELGAPANHPGWWGVPQLCLYANRLDAYDTITRRMLQQYNDSHDDLLKIVILRGCLVHPEPVPQAEELLQMAEELLSQEHQGFPGYGFEGGPGSLFPFGPPPKPAGGPYPKPGPGPPHGPQLGPPLDNQFFGLPDAAAPRELPYYLVALAHLRNGHSDTALEYLEQAVESARYWPAQSMSLPLQAMAYHRLGRSDEAATVLAEAAKTCEQWLGQMEDDALGALSVPWLDFIEYLILYREAHLAITASPLADDPRLAALRQRALAAIEPD